MKKFFLTILVLGSSLFAEEKKLDNQQTYDPFVVRFEERQTFITNAKKYVKKGALVLENNGGEKIFLKVEIPNQHMDLNLTLVPKVRETVVIEMEEKDRLYVTPLSPPSQEAEMSFGGQDYAIPTQEE